MARNWTKWEPEEYDQLEEMYRAGLTYQQMADNLGKTFGQVRGVVEYLGLREQKRPMPHARTDWDEVDQIITDCVQVELMCTPQIVKRLETQGKYMSTRSVQKRINLNPELRKEALRNAKKRQANRSRLYWARQRAKRQQQQGVTA